MQLLKAVLMPLADSHALNGGASHWPGVACCHTNWFNDQTLIRSDLDELHPKVLMLHSAICDVQCCLCPATWAEDGLHMNVFRTLQVLMVDMERRALVVKGSVPGKPGSVIEITPGKLVGKNC